LRQLRPFRDTTPNTSTFPPFSIGGVSIFYQFLFSLP
jgi:hypothetical protein